MIWSQIPKKYPQRISRIEIQWYSFAEQLALDLGSRELIQLSSSLLALQKRQLISCQWLPVLSVWILNYLSKSHGHQDKYKGNAFSTDENENTANVDGKELDPQNKTKEQGQADINFSKISLSNLEDESSCEKERKQEQRGFGLDEKSQLQNRSESQNFSKGSPQLINLIVEEAVQLQVLNLSHNMFYFEFFSPPKISAKYFHIFHPQLIFYLLPWAATSVSE